MTLSFATFAASLTKPRVRDSTFFFLARKRKVSNWHVGNEEEETKVITTSSPHAFQSPLKAKRHLVQQSKQPTESAAMVFACCPIGIQWIKIAK